MANKIQLRRDTTANWARINPILADGEPGLDITSNKIKYGDGTTTWNLLPFASGGETTRLVNDTAVVTLDPAGTLSIPGDIHSDDGVTIVTNRGAVQFGANLEAPGIPTHFHINKSADTPYMDLFFGDDMNYVKLPESGSSVEIGSAEGFEGGSVWTFNSVGRLKLPTGVQPQVGSTVIIDTNNTGGLGGWDIDSLSVAWDPSIVTTYTAGSKITFANGRTSTITSTSDETTYIDIFWDIPQEGNIFPITLKTDNYYPAEPAGITSVAGTDGTAVNISDVAVDAGNNYRVTVTTSVDHGITELGAKVYISGLSRITELNDRFFYTVAGASNTFMLYHDANLIDYVDGSTFSEAYTSTSNRPTTYSGTQTTTDQTPLLGETVIAFDGNSYIRVAPSNDFDFGLAPFTISFWVYQTSYDNSPRIFTFGSYPNEILAMGSDNNITTLTWLNNNQVGDGLGGIDLNTWYYVVITRYQNTIRWSFNGNAGNQMPGLNYDMTLAATKTLTIGNNGEGTAGFAGYIRDFKINIGDGAGVDVGTLTVPTGPASVDTPYTKLLLLTTPGDSSNSYAVTGSGTVVEKMPSADVTVESSASLNGSDYGSVSIRSGTTGLTVNNQRGYAAITKPGSEYPINGTGQQTVLLSALTESVPVNITNPNNNVILVKLAGDYIATGTHMISLPTPPRAGMTITVINDTPIIVDLIGWDAPPYSMGTEETVNLISVDLRSNDFDPPYYEWWITSGWTW